MDNDCVTAGHYSGRHSGRSARRHSWKSLCLEELTSVWTTHQTRTSVQSVEMESWTTVKSATVGWRQMPRLTFTLVRCQSNEVKKHCLRFCLMTRRCCNWSQTLDNYAIVLLTRKRNKWPDKHLHWGLLTSACRHTRKQTHKLDQVLSVHGAGNNNETY